MCEAKHNVGVKYLTRGEALALLDRQARKYLGMSGAEFSRKYKTGALDRDDSRVIRLSFLLVEPEDDDV